MVQLMGEGCRRSLIRECSVNSEAEQIGKKPGNLLAETQVDEKKVECYSDVGLGVAHDEEKCAFKRYSTNVNGKS